MTRPPRPRLGDELIAAGVITEDQLERALKEQSSWGGRLGQNLVTLGFLDEATLASALALHLKLPLVDLDPLVIPAEVVHLLPVGLAERYGLMPLGLEAEGGRLRLACFDPGHAEALAAVTAATGRGVSLALATLSAISRSIRRHYYGEVVAAGSPIGAAFNVTRNSMDQGTPSDREKELEARVASLETRLERMGTFLEALAARIGPGGGRP